MRLLLAILITAVTAGLAGCQTSAAGYPPVDVDMTVRQVSPHVYFVQGAAGAATENKGFISNAGFVVTDDGVVVFDALGSPSLAEKLLSRIRDVTAKPIRKVVVSHYHADHVYGLQVFKDLGAEVIAPEGARDYLSAPAAETLLAARREQLAPWVNADTRLVPPDRYIKADEEFSLGGVKFQLSYLGMAHSEGDLAMLVEPDKVLLSGDVIFEGRVPFVGSANTRNWLVTLERLEAMQVRALIPGHGPMAKNPRAAISLTRRYLAFLRARMGAAVEQWQPFDEAYDAVDWKEFDALPAFFEANRRNAYQVYLSLERESLER